LIWIIWKWTHDFAEKAKIATASNRADPQEGLSDGIRWERIEERIIATDDPNYRPGRIRDVIGLNMDPK
jgi:hypothetical protein